MLVKVLVPFFGESSLTSFNTSIRTSFTQHHEPKQPLSTRRHRQTAYLRCSWTTPILTPAYFWLSLHYSLISLAFLVEFNRKYGKGGFVLYWLLNWITMTALGLVMETMYLVLGPFFPFFLLFWVVWNVSLISPTRSSITLLRRRRRIVEADRSGVGRLPRLERDAELLQLWVCQLPIPTGLEVYESMS